ncbi:hypothetical protein SAY86_006759 [Trapa natans]|uniref:HMA domain-containing protein n=1 Tax=Trapa natans TaxID=22666 RepID=A0AAN7L516_TRANT|nr:hypothetical protein SAY86_006759 [Trapa natans]
MAPMAALSALTTVAVAAPPPRDPRPSFGSFFFFHQYDSHLRAIKSNRSFNHLALRRKCSHGGRSASARVRSAVDDTSQSVEEQPAAVSPYDTVTMFFHAEGRMNESDIPRVSKALEGTEGINNLKIKVVEGIASVELMKETTIQETGVAPSLVEAIQGAGFSLRTLNLSFSDE